MKLSSKKWTIGLKIQLELTQRVGQEEKATGTPFLLAMARGRDVGEEWNDPNINQKLSSRKRNEHIVQV